MTEAETRATAGSGGDPTPPVGPVDTRDPAAGPDGAMPRAEPAPATDPAGPTPTAPTATGPDPDGELAHHQRRARRQVEGAWLGGVCAGLSSHLGVPVLVIRLTFVALFCTQFIGALLYAVLWLVMPMRVDHSAPGLDAASRAGMRPSPARPQAADIGAVAALGALGVGVVWLVQVSGWGMAPEIFWPVTVACVGAALVWRQADLGRLDPDRGAERSWFTRLIAGGGWPAVLRIAVGLLLIGAALTMIIVTQGDLRQLPQVLAMTALALAGLIVVLAPWVSRSRAALEEARAERALADVAAHLHDSVLQTLALIQKQSVDARTVQHLARRQERELRQWLYGDDSRAATLKAALTEAAAEVEDEHAVAVEVVVVGDHDITPGLRAMVQAAREAMVNAARHSGAASIDTYAEVDGDRVEVFVRDRGHGFDPDAVGEDRQGIRGSIVDRMQRHGGRAVIRTSPENGTEVRLEMES